MILTKFVDDNEKSYTVKRSRHFCLQDMTCSFYSVDGFKMLQNSGRMHGVYVRTVAVWSAVQWRERRTPAAHGSAPAGHLHAWRPGGRWRAAKIEPRRPQGRPASPASQASLFAILMSAAYFVIFRDLVQRSINFLEKIGGSWETTIA